MFNLAPLVPVPTPTPNPGLPTLRRALERSKVRLPPRSGWGHTSHQNDTLASNPGSSGWQVDARSQATRPLSRGQTRHPIQPGTNSDQGTRRDHGPRVRTSLTEGPQLPMLREGVRWGPGRPMGHPKGYCWVHGLHPPQGYP